MGQKLIHFQSIWKLNGAITIIVSSFQPRIYKQHFKSNKNFYVSIKFLLYVFISLTKRNIKNVSGGLKTLGRTWNNTLSPTGSLAFLWDSKCHNTCKKNIGLYITLICNLHLILTNNHCIIVRIKKQPFRRDTVQCPSGPGWLPPSEVSSLCGHRCWCLPLCPPAIGPPPDVLCWLQTSEVSSLSCCRCGCLPPAHVDTGQCPD